MNKMTINLTQDHIDAAIFIKEQRQADRHNGDLKMLTGLGICETCPIALALKDAGFPDARVGVATMAYGLFGWENLDDRMLWFRRTFDDRRYSDLGPISFEVDLNTAAENRKKNKNET